MFTAISFRKHIVANTAASHEHCDSRKTMVSGGRSSIGFMGVLAKRRSPREWLNRTQKSGVAHLLPGILSLVPITDPYDTTLDSCSLPLMAALPVSLVMLNLKCCGTKSKE